MKNNIYKPKIWILIPARGGSVSIPQKNLRRICGKPLISYSIETALKVGSIKNVIVITDDVEIRAVAEEEGASVILESAPSPSDETLDAKIFRNLENLRNLGAQESDIILTIQPTSPLIREGTIRKVISKFENKAIKSVLTVVDDRHLSWRIGESGKTQQNFSSRKNRQFLPSHFRETGGIIASRMVDIQSNGTRVNDPVDLVILDEIEAVDIDTFADFYAATHYLSRLNIAIRTDASKMLGMGHIYRSLALATELSRHHLKIYTSKDKPLGTRFFSNYPFKNIKINNFSSFISELDHFKPDLIFLDILDTTDTEIKYIKKKFPDTKIISFEDNGSGANYVDLTVLEFIENKRIPVNKSLRGIEYSILSPAFESKNLKKRNLISEVEHILILFGGTDPSELALKSLLSLERVGYTKKVTLIRGVYGQMELSRFSVKN